MVADQSKLISYTDISSEKEEDLCFKNGISKEWIKLFELPVMCRI